MVSEEPWISIPRIFIPCTSQQSEVQPVRLNFCTIPCHILDKIVCCLDSDLHTFNITAMGDSTNRPAEAYDEIFTMSLVLEEDIDTELEQFALLVRLGLNDQAHDVIISALQHHLSSNEVLESLIAFFLMRKNWAAIRAIAREIHEPPDGPTTNAPLRIALGTWAAGGGNDIHLESPFSCARLLSTSNTEYPVSTWVCEASRTQKNNCMDLMSSRLLWKCSKVSTG